jgi:hypothetical protein
LAGDLLNRVEVVRKLDVRVTRNLRLAHERNAARFKVMRAGTYIPRLHHFEVGDFVFLLHQGMKPPGGSLGIRAREEILRVRAVRESGILELEDRAGRLHHKHFEHCVPCFLPNMDGDIHVDLARPHVDHACSGCGRSDDWPKMLLCDQCNAGWHTYCLTPVLSDVPSGEWVCPKCEQKGVTTEDVKRRRAERTVQEPARPALELPNRGRLEKATKLGRKWHGVGVRHRVKKGGKTLWRYGRCEYAGAHGKTANQWIRVHWSDGTITEHGAKFLEQVKKVHDIDMPSTVKRASDLPALVLTMFSDEGGKLPTGGDLLSAEAPVMPKWELECLFKVLSCSTLQRILDPWAITPVVRDVSGALRLSVKVFTNHPVAEHGAQFEFGLFDQQLYPVHSQPCEAVVALLPTRLLLPWLQFMSLHSYAVVCLRVPQSWADNGDLDVMGFLHGLHQQKRLVRFLCTRGQHVPSRYCWLCLFRDQQQRDFMLPERVTLSGSDLFYLQVDPGSAA